MPYYRRRYILRRRRVYSRRIGTRRAPFRRRVRRARVTRRYGGGGKRKRLSSRSMYPRGKNLIITRPPFNPIMWTKFRMDDQWNFLISGVAPFQQISFYSNNPFDPVVGVSTSACSEYPQLMQLYRNCMCFACKVVVRASPRNINTSEAIIYLMMEDNNGRHLTSGITRDFLMENSHDLVKRVILNPQHVNRNNTQRMSMYRKIKNLQNKKELEPAQYAGTLTGGPPTLTYAYVGTTFRGSGFQSGETCSIMAQITITYYCKLWDRINLDA